MVPFHYAKPTLEIHDSTFECNTKFVKRIMNCLRSNIEGTAQAWKFEARNGKKCSYPISNIYNPFSPNTQHRQQRMLTTFLKFQLLPIKQSCKNKAVKKKEILKPRIRICDQVIRNLKIRIHHSNDSESENPNSNSAKKIL